MSSICSISLAVAPYQVDVRNDSYRRSEWSEWSGDGGGSLTMDWVVVVVGVVVVVKLALVYRHEDLTVYGFHVSHCKNQHLRIEQKHLVVVWLLQRILQPSALFGN